MINYYLKNNFAVVFDEINCSINSIKKDGNELIYEHLPFFSIKLRNKDNSSFVISSFDFDFASASENVFIYHNLYVNVLLFFEPKDNGFSTKIKVKNHTSSVIEWVELNSFGLNPKLKDEDGGSGEILYPYNEGCIVSNMKRRNNSPFPYLEPEYPSLGKYSIFPNMVCSQFICYMEDGYGIYLGLHDKNRGTKHIDFKSCDNSLKIVNRIYSNSDYGKDYEMDFNAVLLFFDGDYYDGMEFYRQWFHQNLIHGLTEIEKNKQLPSWYSLSPIVSIFPIRGHFDTDKMEPNKFYPYKNSIPCIDEFSSLTDSKIMALLMHYEGSAPWAPPYVCPPFGGEKLFSDYVLEMHSHNHLVGVYCSGFGWTEQSKLIETYNRHDDFVSNNYSKLMCSNSDGTIKSLICLQQRDGYDICPCQYESKKLWADEISNVAKLGVDYIQALDQNHGGNCYFCFSSNHAHPPVPGMWQQIESNKAIDMVSRPNHLLLGCESASSEPFISRLQFSDNRFNLNYYIGMPFPIYSYLYHPYVNNFMGNQICMTLSNEPYNYSYRVAYSFICGDMLSMVIDDDGEMHLSWCSGLKVNKAVGTTILKNLNGWRQYKGKDYLCCGVASRPIEVDTNFVSFKTEDGTNLLVKGIQTSAFKYKNKTMQFIANFQLAETKIKFKQPHKIYKDYLSDEYIITNEIKISPLSAVMVEI